MNRAHRRAAAQLIQPVEAPKSASELRLERAFDAVLRAEGLAAELEQARTQVGQYGALIHALVARIGEPVVLTAAELEEAPSREVRLEQGAEGEIILTPSERPADDVSSAA